jgi:hypothetical protein
MDDLVQPIGHLTPRRSPSGEARCCATTQDICEVLGIVGQGHDWHELRRPHRPQDRNHLQPVPTRLSAIDAGAAQVQHDGGWKVSSRDSLDPIFGIPGHVNGETVEEEGEPVFFRANVILFHEEYAVPSMTTTQLLIPQQPPPGDSPLLRSYWDEQPKTTGHITDPSASTDEHRSLCSTHAKPGSSECGRSPAMGAVTAPTDRKVSVESWKCAPSSWQRAPWRWAEPPTPNRRRFAKLDCDLWLCRRANGSSRPSTQS